MNLFIEQKNALFEETVWSISQPLRKKYPQSFKGGSSKKRFASKLQNTRPVKVDEINLEAMYKTIYESEVVRYTLYELMTINDIPNSDILEKPIFSSGHTVFSDFLKRIKATAWVSKGHNEYQHLTDGKCPYCQQKLPEDFEENLASCFDEEYHKEKKKVECFRDDYRKFMLNIYRVGQCNYENGFNCEYIDVYITKLQLEKNSDMFLKKCDDGSTDDVMYIAVSAMIAAFDLTARDFNGGLYFDTSSISSIQLKETFHTVFTALNQEQHYKMMMGEK